MNSLDEFNFSTLVDLGSGSRDALGANSFHFHSFLFSKEFAKKSTWALYEN